MSETRVFPVLADHQAAYELYKQLDVVGKDTTHVVLKSIHHALYFFMMLNSGKFQSAKKAYEYSWDYGGLAGHAQLGFSSSLEDSIDWRKPFLSSWDLGIHGGRYVMANDSTPQSYVRTIVLRYIEDWRRYSECPAYDWAGTGMLWMARNMRWRLLDSMSMGAMYNAREKWAVDFSAAMAEKVFWYWIGRDVLVTVDFPVRVDLRDGHLGFQKSPAVTFPDGANVWCLDGVIGAARTINRKLIPWHVLNEKNAELRRVMFEMVGPERMLEGADLIDTGSRGRLWRVRGFNSRILEVVNSTPRPDGSDKKYYLFVSRSSTSADEAVASTFGIRPGSTIFGPQYYNPTVET